VSAGAWRCGCVGSEPTGSFGFCWTCGQARPGGASNEPGRVEERARWRQEGGPWRAVMALGPRGEAGFKGGLPWRLKSELAWFKEATQGAMLALGRPTWEEMPGTLPGRFVAALGSSPPAGLERLGGRGHWARSLPEALDLARGLGATPCLAGGPSAWRRGWDQVGMAWITRVEGPMRADAFFEPDLSGFEMSSLGPEGSEGGWTWSARLWVRR
jgi:dihydrofolate reductase